MWDHVGSKPMAANGKGEREGEVGYFSIYWHASVLPSRFSNTSARASRACGCCLYSAQCGESAGQTGSCLLCKLVPAPPRRANTLSFDRVHILSTFLWAAARVPPTWQHRRK